VIIATVRAAVANRSDSGWRLALRAFEVAKLPEGPQAGGGAAHKADVLDYYRERGPEAWQTSLKTGESRSTPA
jgi:hypothetical protein